MRTAQYFCTRTLTVNFDPKIKTCPAEIKTSQSLFTGIFLNCKDLTSASRNIEHVN